VSKSVFVLVFFDRLQLDKAKSQGTAKLATEYNLREKLFGMAHERYGIRTGPYTPRWKEMMQSNKQLQNGRQRKN